MIEALDLESRQIPHYDDDLHFYKARIYSSGKERDDRLQVRILPHMVAINDQNEMANFPRYPSFFKNQVLQGFTEVDDGKDKADLVYVIATSDFQYGYVVGLCNQFEGAIRSSVFKDSYGFKVAKRFIKRRGLFPEKFEYKNVVIQNMSLSDNGGILELFNFRTGDKFIIQTSGTMLALTQKKIVLRIGGLDKSFGSKVFTSITMTNNKILMQAKGGSIELSADKGIVLGHHGHVVTGTIGEMMSVGVDGMNIGGISSIMV